MTTEQSPGTLCTLAEAEEIVDSVTRANETRHPDNQRIPRGWDMTLDPKNEEG